MNNICVQQRQPHNQELCVCWCKGLLFGNQCLQNMNTYIKIYAHVKTSYYVIKLQKSYEHVRTIYIYDDNGIFKI